MKSQMWAPLWVDAASNKCQIQMVQNAKKWYTLSIIYSINPRGYPPLGAISLVQAVCVLKFQNRVQYHKKADNIIICTARPFIIFCLAGLGRNRVHNSNGQIHNRT